MTATLPVNYTEARRALAAAYRVDEVKDIRDKAVAMQVYAKQAKDGELIAHATEIRKRAERRLGEIIEDERRPGNWRRAREAKGSGNAGRLRTRVLSLSAASTSISRTAHARWRRCQRQVRGGRREGGQDRGGCRRGQHGGDQLQRVRSVMPPSASGARNASAHWPKDTALPDKRIRRDHRRPGMAMKSMVSEGAGWIACQQPLPHHRMRSDKGSRRTENRGRDCVLFMWTTPPLRIAIGVMKHWGFEYISNAAWVKTRRHRTLVSIRHEHLLLMARGKVPCPAPGDQWDSVIDSRAAVTAKSPTCSTN